MKIHLSPRLAAVAEQVPVGSIMVDVGTDHANLPIWMIENERVVGAIGVDVAVGPLKQARRQAEAHFSKVQVRHSDGLSSIEPGEVNCVTICGMGGSTIARILADGQAVLKHVRRIVVQPQGMEVDVRTLLLSLGWVCVQACLVAEKKHLYVVESWERRPNGPVWSDADLRWGRLIRRAPDPLFCTWIRRQLANVDQGLQRMQRAGQSDHSDAVDLRNERLRLESELRLIVDG